MFSGFSCIHSVTRCFSASVAFPAIYFCNNSGFIFYAVLLETTQEETTLKENEEKYKKIISVLKNIRIPIRSGLIIKEEIK
jgi:dihydroorotase